MGDAPNTVFIRLEGPLQAWGDNSKFVIRRTMEGPTKSGVIGLICCAMGLSRRAARERLPELNKLAMGVRIDRPGTRWWDYHTVGAGYGLLTAAGKIKRTASTGDYETLVSRREYLCDASFLVALQGDVETIRRVRAALYNPQWPVYLGRKSCPPCVPVLAQPGEGESWTNPMRQGSLLDAFRAVPWRPRLRGEHPHGPLTCLLEWQAAHEGDIAPPEAEVWYDRPVLFDPPVHEPRLLLRDEVSVGSDGMPDPGEATQQRTPAPPRPRADYRNTQYREARKRRLDDDHHLCVFCKLEATTVQHVTYRRAGGGERPEDLRALCRLCHDAVTMLEYGLGMGLDRINPEDAVWRERIIAKRDEILRWRSVEGRRRALRGAPDPVRRELLEESEG